MAENQPTARAVPTEIVNEGAGFSERGFSEFLTSSGLDRQVLELDDKEGPDPNNARLPEPAPEPPTAPPTAAPSGSDDEWDAAAAKHLQDPATAPPPGGDPLNEASPQPQDLATDHSPLAHRESGAVPAQDLGPGASPHPGISPAPPSSFQQVQALLGGYNQAFQDLANREQQIGQLRESDPARYAQLTTDLEGYKQQLQQGYQTTVRQAQVLQRQEQEQAREYSDAQLRYVRAAENLQDDRAHKQILDAGIKAFEGTGFSRKEMAASAANDPRTYRAVLRAGKEHLRAQHLAEENKRLRAQLKRRENREDDDAYATRSSATGGGSPHMQDFYRYVEDHIDEL